MLNKTYLRTTLRSKLHLSDVVLNRVIRHRLTLSSTCSQLRLKSFFAFRTRHRVDQLCNHNADL